MPKSIMRWIVQWLYITDAPATKIRIIYNHSNKESCYNYVNEYKYNFFF